MRAAKCSPTRFEWVRGWELASRHGPNSTDWTACFCDRHAHRGLQATGQRCARLESKHGRAPTITEGSPLAVPGQPFTGQPRAPWASLRPMKITVTSSKGGVGKSSLACLLAAEWSEQGRRVLLLDADPQGTSIRWSERRLARGLETPVVTGVGDNVAAVMRQQARDYDVVLVDTAGRLGDRSVMALGSSDIALVPVQASGPSLWTIGDSLNAIETAQSVREAHGIPRVRVGIVANMVRRTAVQDSGVRALGKMQGASFLGNIRLAADIDSAMSQGTGCPRASMVALDIRELAERLETMPTELVHVA
jgi:cellulose biosynthesis protein BcsQ